MKLIVACVDSSYDLSKLKSLYPDHVLYITAKSESVAKVHKMIDEADLVFNDTSTTDQNDYVSYASKKRKKIMTVEDLNAI